MFVGRRKLIKKKNKIPIVATRQYKDVENYKTRAETYGNAASRRCRVARARVYTIGRRVGGVLVEYNIVILLLCLSANGTSVRLCTTFVSGECLFLVS